MQASPLLPTRVASQEYLCHASHDSSHGADPSSAGVRDVHVEDLVTQGCLMLESGFLVEV